MIDSGGVGRGLGLGIGVTAVYLAALSVGGPALDDIQLGSRRGLAVFPLGVIAAVVVLGPLLSVGSAAGRTRDALQAYGAS